MKCPACGKPLESLLASGSEGLYPTGELGCFNGCKYPDNRWQPWGRYGTLCRWSTLNETKGAD